MKVCSNSFLAFVDKQVEAEEEKQEEVVKEKKDVKKHKSWGRRSTRAKKYISYRYNLSYLTLVKVSFQSLFKLFFNPHLWQV